MRDRKGRVSELIDEETRHFFRNVVEETCPLPWSLWEREGLIVSARRVEGGSAETVLWPKIVEWFQTSDSDGQAGHIETAGGLCLVFPLRCDVEVAGVLVIGPLAKEDASPHIQTIGKLLANLTGLVLRNNLKQAHLVASSYQQLIQRNQELEESKKRYRELAGILKVRIAQKISELKNAHVRLLQADKMASIGQLAAGIAHEINNPLAFIKSNVNTCFLMAQDIINVVKAAPFLSNGGSSDVDKIFREKTGQNMEELFADFESLVTETLEGVVRVQRIVSDLKEFSHIDDAEVGLLDIHKSLDTTVSVLRFEIRPGMEIIRRYGENIPPIKCHLRQIGQVFMNILLNAVQAIDGQGKIIICTSSADGVVNIEIGDTGRGIPPDILPRIFEPFFTTKPVGQGTGTGLSICYEVIKAHGGKIEAQSEPGKGTVIAISLPIDAEEVRARDVQMDS